MICSLEQTGRTGLSDKAYENATSRRNELAIAIASAQQTLESLRSELKNVDKFIADWHSFAGTQPPVGAPTIMGDPSQPIFKMRRNSRKEEVAEAAIAMIREAGVPLSRATLLEGLVGRGLIIEGGEPDVVLSTMLWRMKGKIVRLQKGGYWPADSPSPDGSYVPGGSLFDG
jgi:hypothetical protein